MLKELFLAIILGALLGFGITGGYLAINKKNNPQETQTVITTPTPTESNILSTDNNQTENLSLDSLEDLDVVSKEDLEIKGTTTPNSIVIATLGEQSKNTNSDDNGKFNLDITLESGLNIIKITVIDSNNNQIEKTINITYSTATI